MAVPDLVYSSTLAAAVGLGWSKDNLRLIADGWSQGATEVQVLFAALSLGPAGLADQLEGFPAIARPGVRCAFFDSNFHSMMPLVPTPSRL
jgi:hypothetical protein